VGGIKRRKDGRYEAKYTVETPAGLKRRSVYGKTREEVAVKLAAAMVDQPEETTPETKPANITVREFFEEMHDDAVRHAVKRRTYESYRCIVNRHIIPVLGNHKLVSLTTRQVQDFYGGLLSSGLSPKTVTNVDTTLRRALKQGVRWGLVKHNACEGVSVPRHFTPEMMPLNRKQARAFLEAAKGDPLEALYVTAITTGLRQGELLGLRWSDLNFEARTLTVRRALVTGYGRQTFEHPKTRRSRRTVALTKRAAEALARHHEKRAGEHELIFTNGVGNPINPSNLRLRSFKPLLNRAKLPDIRFHDLRHTTASIALSNGVSPKVIQAMLGHANISITLDTYSHLLDGMEGRAADGIDEALG